MGWKGNHWEDPEQNRGAGQASQGRALAASRPAQPRGAIVREVFRGLRRSDPHPALCFSGPWGVGLPRHEMERWPVYPPRSCRSCGCHSGARLKNPAFQYGTNFAGGEAWELGHQTAISTVERLTETWGISSPPASRSSMCNLMASLMLSTASSYVSP